MFALPISKPRFKSINFQPNSPKMKLFLQKNAKFSSAGGLPPNPQPPAAGGEAPKTAPPIVNFWLRACLAYLKSYGLPFSISCNKFFPYFSVEMKNKS